jgi:hypothetical protein
MRELLGEPRYAGCDPGGCVLVGCERPHGPTLAFVDISMSRAFRSGYPNDIGRRGDVLLLGHVDDPPTNTRFYNRVLRINGGSSPVDYIQIYPPTAQSPDPGLPPLAGGRRSKKTKKNRKRTRSSRKVLRNR